MSVGDWRDKLSELSEGALIWICAPNTEKFHEYPIDAWRIWPDGMRALFREAGIQEISCFADEADTVGIGRLSR